MSEAGEERYSRLPRWIATVPLLLVAFCLLAILPLLFYVPASPSEAFQSGKSIATIALVSYPIVLSTVVAIAARAKRQGRLALAPLRLVFFSFLAAFVMALGTAGALMWLT